MEQKDENKQLQLENKKLAREVKRLNQDIAMLREAIEQAAYTQAYIRKETDRQLFYIEQLMSASTNILILTDADLRTVITSDLYFQYNPRYDKHTIRHGVPLRDALVGIFPEDELNDFMGKCLAARGGRPAKPFVLHGIHAEKRQFWRCFIGCMCNGGEVVGLNILISDITEIMDALERAEAADKAKSNFLAKMSHEIRTPINAILGLNEVILRDSREPETVEYAGDIQNAGKTLLSLINDILDFSKVEEGKMEILPTQYELGSVINDLVNMVRTRAEEKGLEFYVFVDETTPHLLYGDEIRIRQCALNLLINAVKYTNSGSVTLTIGYDEIDADRIRLKISVTDTGLGIKPEDMERLTSPFARLEESRIRSIEGTGLGLAITKQLLDLMGSSLQVESIYGEGSQFSFAIQQPVVKWWPVGKFDGHYKTDGALGAARLKAFTAPEARVLVVDDMPLNLTVVKGLLKKTQLQLDTADSGPKALEMLKKQRYDIAFIDHMMPEMDGIETLRELKKLPQTEDTVCIALTANAISGSREMYIDAGFQDYLSKPVDSEKLDEMLLKYLPPAKVVLQTGSPEPSAPEGSGAAEGGSLPERLYRLEELDVPLGLKACGSEETYLETLSIFKRNVTLSASEIEGYRHAGDTPNVVTKVHALKSAARVIGAEELGALAEKLELAGKAGDTDTLYGELDALLTRCRALGERLQETLAAQEAPQDALPPVTAGELHEVYDSALMLLEDLEYDRAADVLRTLSGFSLPEAERERYETLMRAVDNYEWEQLTELLK